MEKMLNHIVEVIMLIGMLFLTIKFWSWKFKRGYQINKGNLSYSIFICFQLMTLFLIFLLSQDVQISVFLETLQLFGSTAINYWIYIGVLISGVSISFILSNLIGHLLFLTAIKDEISLYDEIKANNISQVILSSTITLIVGMLLGNYLLKPLLFDWISNSRNLIPMI
jgi:hypothetical protein